MPGGRVPSSRSWESGKSREEVGDGAHDDAPAAEGWGRNAHRMGTFNVVVNLVLVVAALVTVWFAWQASKEGAAARYARESVLAAQEVAHTSATVEAVREAADWTHRTAEAFDDALVYQ